MKVPPNRPPHCCFHLGPHQDTAQINDKVTKLQGGGEEKKKKKLGADISSTVNLSEQVMVDYSQRGHCLEQSELMEPDTCQSKTSSGPDFIQDILLLLREITGPAVLSLWEAAARPNMSHAYSERCSNPRRPGSIFVLQSTAITVEILLIVFSLCSQQWEQAGNNGHYLLLLYLCITTWVDKSTIDTVVKLVRSAL